MAKIRIKPEKNTLFGGIFHVREMFSHYVGPVIDEVLGGALHFIGYQFKEFVDFLSRVRLCSGDCARGCDKPSDWK